MISTLTGWRALQAAPRGRKSAEWGQEPSLRSRLALTTHFILQTATPFTERLLSPSTVAVAQVGLEPTASLRPTLRVGARARVVCQLPTEPTFDPPCCSGPPGSRTTIPWVQTRYLPVGRAAQDRADTISLNQARGEGFEPSLSGSKPDGLPLADPRGGKREGRKQKPETWKSTLNSICFLDSFFCFPFSAFPQAAVAGIEPASGRLTGVCPYQHGDTTRVGAAGFEPAFSCSQSTWTSRFSHTPKERPAGVEPALPPWQGSRLPLHHGCVSPGRIVKERNCRRAQGCLAPEYRNPACVQGVPDTFTARHLYFQWDQRGSNPHLAD